jgi:hypothetical protein
LQNFFITTGRPEMLDLKGKIEAGKDMNGTASRALHAARSSPFPSTA